MQRALEHASQLTEGSIGVGTAAIVNRIGRGCDGGIASAEELKVDHSKLARANIRMAAAGFIGDVGTWRRAEQSVVGRHTREQLLAYEDTGAFDEPPNIASITDTTPDSFIAELLAHAKDVMTGSSAANADDILIHKSSSGLSVCNVMQSTSAYGMLTRNFAGQHRMVFGEQVCPLTKP